MGKHYNSIRRGDDPCEEYIGAVKKYVIGHDLKKVIKIVKSGEENLI